MKIIISLFITLSLLAGCASVPNAQDQLPVEIQRSTVIFDSVNSKIWGEVWKPETPMKDFNLDRYKEILASFQSERALELQDILESYETQILRGYENTFVFCVFSSKQGFAMCDDARCSGVERKDISSSPDIIETWWKDFPLTNCQKH